MDLLTGCPSQAQAETLPEYATRVLRHALGQGPGLLTLDQLTQADHAAQLEICRLPAKLETLDQGRLLARLHACRLEMAARMDERRAQEAQDAQAMARWSGDADAPDLDPQAPGDAPDHAPDNPQARAFRLLRAALTLILDGNDPHPSNGGGGRPAPLIPPAPTRPPAGIALDARTADRRPRPSDDIPF